MYQRLSILVSLGIVNKEDVIEYLMDNNYKGIINDLNNYNVEYNIDDIPRIWDNFLVYFNVLANAN